MNVRTIAVGTIAILSLLAAADLRALKIEPPALPNDTASIYGVTPPAAQSGEELRRGTFSANVVITDSEETFRKWLSAPPRQRHACTPKFRAGQKGYLVLVLTDYKLDPSSPVDLTAELTLIAPDGKVVYQHRDLGKSAWGSPKKGYLAIEPHVDFSFDDTDRPGTYTYKLTVADHTRGEIATTEEKVILVR